MAKLLRIALAALVLAAFSLPLSMMGVRPAAAQTSCGFQTGQVATAYGINICSVGKLDYGAWGGALSGIGLSPQLATGLTINSPILNTPSISTPTISGGTLTNPSLVNPTLTGASISGGTLNNSTIGGVTPAAGSFTALTDTGITGSTQCLHANSAGVITGTGADCPVTGSVVTSFNSRGGVVVPASGDYTAAQVTNAADKTSANTFTTGAQSMLAEVINGAAGSGYVEFDNQSVAPASPASTNFRVFSSSGHFAWVGASGYVKTFDGSALTASRTYSLPDLAGTLTVLGNTTTGSGSTLVLGTGAAIGTPAISGGTINNAVIGGVTPAAATFSSITDTGITGSTQCLEVNSSGALVGFGAGCAGGASGGKQGTWTPTFSFTTPGNLSVSYNAGRFGTYTCVNVTGGALVEVEAHITASTFTFTTASGTFIMGSLPYAMTNTSLGPGGTITNTNGNVTWTGAPRLQVNDSTHFTINNLASGSSGANWTTANFTTGSPPTIDFTATYQTASSC